MDHDELEYRLDDLESFFRYEMPRNRLDRIEELRVDTWEAFLIPARESGWDLTTIEPRSGRAQLLLQVAALSNLIVILPRKPFPPIGNRILSILRHSGAYGNKLEFPWMANLLKLISLVGPIAIAMLVYAAGFGWIGLLVGLVSSWWVLAGVSDRHLQRVMTIAALESNSLFNFLWDAQLYACLLYTSDAADE